MCSTADGGCDIVVAPTDYPRGDQLIGMAPGLSLPILDGLVHNWFDDHNDVFRDWDMRKIMADSIRLSRQYAIGPQYLFIRVDFRNGAIKRTSINADPHTVPSMLNISNGAAGAGGSHGNVPSRGTATAASTRRASNASAASKRVSKIIFYMELPSCSMEMRDAIVDTCRDGRSLAERVFKTVRCAIGNRFDFRIAMELFDETSMYYMPTVAMELAKYPLLLERLYELQLQARDLRIASSTTAETQKTWWVSPPLCWLSHRSGLSGTRDREGVSVVSESDMRLLGESISEEDVHHAGGGAGWDAADGSMSCCEHTEGASPDVGRHDDSYDSDESNYYISTAWDAADGPVVGSDDEDMVHEGVADDEDELSDDSDGGDSYF